MKLNYEDLKMRYDRNAGRAICSCSFITHLAGGQPADESGVKLFISHHLKLSGQEAEEAYRRIVGEEIGEKPVPAEGGELEERISYGINVIRRGPHGPYLGNWMIQACAKQAASRLNIFVETKGSKGDLSEGGLVTAHGISLLEPESPDHIYLIGPDGGQTQTSYQSFKGRVSSPRGSKSIVHDSECAPPGTRFEFSLQFLGQRLKEEDVSDFLALMMVVGLGSCKSLGCGRFKIVEADLTMPEKRRKEKNPKKEIEGVSDSVRTEAA